jgi:hypothetical protein
VRLTRVTLDPISGFYFISTDVKDLAMRGTVAVDAVINRASAAGYFHLNRNFQIAAL